MKQKLQEILEENRGTILESVINEIIDEEEPLDSLLYFEKNWVEWGLVQCLEFEKDCIKFFNKHYIEIEWIRRYLQLTWNTTEVAERYSIKEYYSYVAFKFISFELYMELIIEDL